ncbi:syntaxin-4 isoform X1 [Pseudonaja textilis]|uniref:syntaxin-4 isoform X1 n=1 Tax=Pseudonaja textilis TaxID=8673 RepID=UPI000EA98949|nr:syntaxin-4 isoform X1 [Pseudonaja textilis]
MRDRTQELREKDDESDNENVESVALVTQHGSAIHSNFPDPTDGFFQMTRDIREALKILENKVKDLEKNQTTVLASPIPDDNTKQGLQKLREEIKESAKDIRAQLKRIEPMKEEQDENRNSFNNRMKRNQHGILSQQFLDLINKCNSVQSDYRDRNLERIKRHLQITGSTVVSDDELDEMLESGQTEVFISNLMKDTQVTKQALNDIETRHNEILKLERSIQELHDLFMFLATEVELQGDMIDRIEKNILDSGDYVKKGQLHLHQAQESQKKALKKDFPTPPVSLFMLHDQSLMDFPWAASLSWNCSPFTGEAFALQVTGGAPLGPFSPGSTCCLCLEIFPTFKTMSRCL